MLTKCYCRASSPSLLSKINASTSPQERPNSISSPLLKALAAYSPSEPANPSTYPTTEWTKNIPFGRSPPDIGNAGPSIAGSPPDHLQPHDELRGRFNNASPPTSPSAAYRQPVRQNNGYQSFGDYLGSSPGRGRPMSMHSQQSQAPPLPHQTQAHFYGAPEIDFGVHQPRSDTNAGDRFCCVFDSLPGAGDEGSSATENVLLVGSEHELDVYRVGKKNLDRIGRLKELRGSVHGAKILPSVSRSDPLRAFRPLVALIIHGLHNPNEPENSSRPGTSHSEDAVFDPSDSVLHALHNADAGISKPKLLYQTTVEVYSLRKGQHVATLFRSPKVEVDVPRGGAGPTDCSPVGNLNIQAKGKFLVIGSGTSGEVYIFDNQNGNPDDPSSHFKCLGKVWTRVSSKKTRSLSISSNSSEADNHGASAAKFRQPDVALFSLSHRWLAIVPPLSSAQTTLHGTVDSVRSQKPPGFVSHTSPAEPQITCDVETPDGESVLSKVARDVTQEFIKGARWVGDQGKQAWNNYWTKAPESHPIPSYPPSNHSRWDPNPQPMFPPTHANDEISNRPGSQPALVSIIDLERLSTAQNVKPAVALQPIATFPLTYGCSLVSFSPTGLNILTASAKGDVQHVWDLLRMIHGGTGPTSAKDRASEKRASVREVARFTRMTVAKIIDVVWTEPKGGRFAIVTERGTVHIFDMPTSAFQWPPPRRTKRSVSLPSNPSPSSKEIENVVPPVPASSALSAALDLVTGKTQPLLAAVRGRPANIGNALVGLGGMAFTAGAGAKSGKAVAAGFTKSVGAATGTVNTLRHLGENRLALPGSPSAVVPGCVRWLSGKDQGLIAVTGGGLVRIHSIRQSANHKAARRRPSVLGGKPIEFSLLSASPGSKKAILKDDPAIDPQLDKSSTPPYGFWIPSATDVASKPLKPMAHPLSYAEIETNAPYQPFHTDRRINFSIYDEPNLFHPRPAPEVSAPWAFGEDIPATRIGSSAATTLDEDNHHAPTQMENFISIEGNDEEGRQVLVTTRRKRGAKRGPTRDDTEEAEEDFFEDDCEVVDFAEERV